MSRQKATNLDAVERALYGLLTHSASAIPSDLDRTQQVRRRLLGEAREETPARWARTGWTWSNLQVGSLAAMVSLVLLVALFAGVFAWLRLPARGAQHLATTGIFGPAVTPTVTPGIDSTAIVNIPGVPPLVCDERLALDGRDIFMQADATPGPDHSTVVGRQVNMHGVTLQITHAYADATRTVVSYRVSPDPATTLVLVTLTDAQGAHYPFMRGGWQRGHDGLFEFAPLPQAALATPQTLTFTAENMDTSIPTGAGTPTSGTPTVGPWRITFDLTPVAGQSFTLSSQPIEHSGVSVQPLRLDVAPPGGGLDGLAGGARLIVRISGLDARAQPGDLANLVNTTFYNSFLGGGASCGGGEFVLQLPNGQWRRPASVVALSQTLGPGGTADIALLYFTPVTVSAGIPFTLAINTVAVAATADQPAKRTNGPWVFHFST